MHLAHKVEKEHEEQLVYFRAKAKLGVEFSSIYYEREHFNSLGCSLEEHEELIFEA